MEDKMKIDTFKLEEYLGKYEFKAQHLLCLSDAQSFSMHDILALADEQDRARWNNLSLGYTEVQGLPVLREQIAKSLYPTLNQNNILCFAGAEEGIFCTLHALCESGDHVIVLTPCYQSLMEIPKINGCEISTVALQEENEWHIDIKKIEQSIKPNTKCVVINFPHNPTGQIISQEELSELVTLLDKHGIWLFSDEVYRLLGASKKAWAQPAAEIYHKAVSLGVMSKSLGMAGLRVGWVACQDQELLKKIEAIKHYTSICNSAPAEILSLIALKNMNTILERNNNIIYNNLSVLDQFFIKHQNLFSWVRPQGGCIGFVRYKGHESVDNFCSSLLNQENVLLLPASVYDYPGNHFRIGFGRSTMIEALNKLEHFLSK